MKIFTVFCILFLSAGSAQDDSGVQMDSIPDSDGNGPFRPRPPPEDRCPRFSDWKNVTCWWPDVAFSDLPSECTYIYLPKKVPTAIQQLIRDKAEEAYNAISFEYSQRGRPAKCGHCARSFKCRSRNLTDDSGRPGPFCRPKEIVPVQDDCNDPAPCEISKDRGLCSEPFFLNPAKIGRINDLIKQKDHQGVADELFSVLPRVGKRSKRQAGAYNDDFAGADGDYGMSPQFDDGNSGDDGFGIQRDPGFGSNGGRRGGRDRFQGPSGNDDGFGGDDSGFGPQQDDPFDRQRPPTPFGPRRGGDDGGDGGNFGPFPGQGRRGGRQGGRKFGPGPDGDNSGYGPGRGGRRGPGGLGPVPEDDGPAGGNFGPFPGPGRRGGPQGGRGFGPDGDDQGFGPGRGGRQGGRRGPGGDGSDGDGFGPRQDDPNDQQGPPPPFGPRPDGRGRFGPGDDDFGPFPGRRGFGPGGRGGRRGPPPPFGPGDDDSDFGPFPGGRGGRRGPPPPFGPGDDDFGPFPGRRGGRRGPPPFGPGPFGPRGRGGRRPPFGPPPFGSDNDFGSMSGQFGMGMMPMRFSLMTMPQMSLWTGNQRNIEGSQPLDHHEEARGFVHKLLHGTTCISSGDKCLCCCGPFIPNAANKTCDDVRKLFPGIEGVAENLIDPGNQEPNAPSVTIEMPADNDENQNQPRSMPVKIPKPDVDF